MRLKVVVMAVVAAVAASVPTAALAAPPSSSAASATGYDVSYPQCSSALPTAPAFGIVGVNDGIVYAANPCLAAEYAWAQQSSSTTQARVQFYANTGNPGPVLSSHWPSGQQAPEVCDGSWNFKCSYDYGWNAAQDSFATAAAVAGAAAATVPWWLDVESANSWSSDTSTNIGSLQGAVAYLKSVGVAVVGFYSNSSSWTSIVASRTVFAANPAWIPGSRSAKDAKADCSKPSVTGGRITYTQYPSGRFDADYAC